MKKQRTDNRPVKTKKISAALSRSIALILILSVLVPIAAYYMLPDWAYYLTAATRLLFAGQQLSAALDGDNPLDGVKDVEMSYDSDVEIYDSRGNLIYSTIAVKSGAEVDMQRETVLDDSYRIDYDIIDGSFSDSVPWGYILRGYDERNVSATFLEHYVNLSDGERLCIVMQVSQTTMVSKIEILIVYIALMLCLVIAMAVIIKYMKKFTQPINKMVDVTGKMSRLDFSEECPPVKYEELAQLSDSINDMSKSLSNAMGELQANNEKLQKDIENERTIDELRQTFISGISHELKTPIAIIQGYAEGAKAFYASGNTALADKYCDTIAEEATRMNDMILKLLEITRYDSGAYEPVRENFNIHDDVQDWFDRNAKQIEEKNVTVVNGIPAGTLINGDRFLLTSNVNNYLSNAMSHVSGDRVIEASVERVNGKTRVCIRNTGPNIAEKDIDKIWTSFYRVDKSLSRKQGRFGLGLATVASIQKLHGEAYGVENLPDGVKFWFDAEPASFVDKISE